MPATVVRPNALTAGLLTALSRPLIAAADTRQTPYVIDYEHQTLRSAKNGLPAPASGWFKKLEWREGVGLFAVDVEWTDAAAAAIDAWRIPVYLPYFCTTPVVWSPR